MQQTDGWLGRDNEVITRFGCVGMFMVEQSSPRRFVVLQADPVVWINTEGLGESYCDDLNWTELQDDWIAFIERRCDIVKITIRAASERAHYIYKLYDVVVDDVSYVEKYNKCIGVFVD